MAKILRGLRIDEVSSVSAGAGRGVKVVLMKRADPLPGLEHPALRLAAALQNITPTLSVQQALRRAAALIRSCKTMTKTEIGRAHV